MFFYSYLNHYSSFDWSNCKDTKGYKKKISQKVAILNRFFDRRTIFILGCKIRGFVSGRTRIQNSKFKIQDSRFIRQWTDKDSKFKIQDSRFIRQLTDKDWSVRGRTSFEDWAPIKNRRQRVIQNSRFKIQDSSVSWRTKIDP